MLNIFPLIQELEGGGDQRRAGFAGEDRTMSVLHRGESAVWHEGGFRSEA